MRQQLDAEGREQVGLFPVHPAQALALQDGPDLAADLLGGDAAVARQARGWSVGAGASAKLRYFAKSTPGAALLPT